MSIQFPQRPAILAWLVIIYVIYAIFGGLMSSKRATLTGGAATPVVRGFTDTRARKWVEITDKDVSVLVELRDFAGDRMSIWRNLADRGC